MALVFAEVRRNEHPRRSAAYQVWDAIAAALRKGVPSPRGETMAPRAADDYAAIRARMDELRAERERAARMADEEPTDTGRWRVVDDVRVRLFQRRNGADEPR
jgi:hypothetical protein